MNSVANCFRDLLGAHYALYVDDGLCYHKWFYEQIQFLQRILNRLRAAKLRITPVQFEALSRLSLPRATQKVENCYILFRPNEGVVGGQTQTKVAHSLVDETCEDKINIVSL